MKLSRTIWKLWSSCWLFLGLTALWDSISVYIGPSPRERKKEEKWQTRERNVQNKPPPAPTASAVGPCPTVVQIVGRPGTGSLPSTIAPPDHPRYGADTNVQPLTDGRTYTQKFGGYNIIPRHFLWRGIRKKKTSSTDGFVQAEWQIVQTRIPLLHCFLKHILPVISTATTVVQW